MRSRRRRPTRAGLILGALLATAACADAGVDTVSAEPIDRSAPTTSAPPEEAGSEPPASTLPDEPASTRPDASAGGPPATAPPDTTAEDSTSGSVQPTPPPTGDDEDLAAAGDELYPELGNADIDVQHYVVRVAYDPDTQEIDGHVSITVAAPAATDHVVFDATEMAVVSVAVDGADVDFTKAAEELVVHQPLSAGEVVTVDVVYEDSAGSSSGAFGLDAGWFATPDGSYVLNEPDALRTWMPAHDHPSDKATWRFEITVPDGLTGVANGTLIEERPGDATTTWIWEADEPMTTYLVQLLTGEYSVLDGGTAGTVPLVNVALTADVERMQPYFALTDDQIAFFEEYFGPYPLDQYGLAFTDSFGGLAMETQGRSLFSRDDFPGGDPGYVEHLLLSHELSHQWFGNAVSPAEWSDLWLNESFATYAQWMWLEEAGLSDLERDATGALELRQQIAAEPTGTPSVGNLFGFERYDGGAVVVHALRLELGDEAFFELLQRWVAENEGTSRTTDDFIGLAEDVAGRSLTEFFDAWLFAVDVPAEFPS